jgi:acyl carrier protein
MLIKIFNKIRPNTDVASSNDIVSDYGLDSFDILEIITMIEDMYNIQLNLTNISINDFKTFESIERFIELNSKAKQ